MGGSNEEENLALGCPHCNAQKGKTSEAVDPLSGESVSYFNPRVHVWEEHFRWSSAEVGILLGLTLIGRATIAGLELNHPKMIELRSLLAQLGLFAEVLLEIES